MKTKKTEHSVYNLNYHIVIVVKYRHSVLVGEVEDYLKEQITQICANYGYELLSLEAMPDHVHMFVSAPPTVAPNAIARTIKSITAIQLFKKYPLLKQKKFWGSGLWTDGTYYGSAGAVSAEIIKKYIENQKSS